MSPDPNQGQYTSTAPQWVSKLWENHPGMAILALLLLLILVAHFSDPEQDDPES